MRPTLGLMPILVGMATSSAAVEAAKTPALTRDQQQVLGLERQWATAEDKHDAAALRRILDDRFTAQFNAKGPYDKETFINGETSGVVDPTQTQTLDEKVIVAGDTAIVLGVDELRGTRKGKPYFARARYTVTYIHRNGRWVALAEHIVDAPADQN